LYAARDFARFRKQFYFDVTSGNVGYLALLERIQNIRNFQANVVALEQDLNAHQALNAAGLVSRLQVDQVFQSYQSGRLSLLRAQNDFQTALDLYKVRLGLPPGLPVTLDDGMVAPFQFADAAVEQTLAELTRLLANYRELDAVPDVPLLQHAYQDIAIYQARIRSLLEQMPQQMERASKPAITNAAPMEQEWFEYRMATLQEADARLLELSIELQKLGQDASNASQQLAESNRVEHWEAVQKFIRQQVSMVSELDVLQTRVRAYHIEIDPIRLSTDAAVQIALENRLDLLNRRAEVVDAWRNIQISANRLKGFLDVNLSGDIATELNSDNPFDFSSSASGYRTAMRFEAPLNRQAERNAYRAQLIQYQRIRRRYMAVEDQVVREVRRDLRDLENNRINFEITRQSLITAARQVEEAGDQLLLPGPASDSSHTQDSLNALNSMLQTKNALISIWVNYETTRVQLLLDLEALQPDPCVEPADFYFNPALESP
jgi:outer membrane protein TolC